MPDADLSARLRDAILADPLGDAISSAEIFGSRARGEGRPDSDLDVVVDFVLGAHVDLWDLAALQGRLSEKLGLAVDLVPSRSLSPRLRQLISRHATAVRR